ncbi:MAG: peptidase S1 [Treponema sp. CETP13]|nr:MAG: peptidase S1 [Treponema sp. CETP13]
MKVYTRRHLIISILITILFCTVFFVAFSLGKQSSANNKKIVETDRSTVTNETNIANQSLDDNSVILTNSTGSTKSLNIDVTNQYTQDELQNINVYDTRSAAVVNISTEVIGYNWFLEAIPQDGSTGSGSIIDSRGYVVTNRHVIDGAYKIYISLADGTQYEAEIIGEDTQTDLAVLKFEPPAGMELTTIPFADSSNLRVGQKVIAIGNPFGFDRTMTTGIVSSLQRPLKNSDDVIIQNMIQTDTSINPGNSGGPLLDTSGRMIGINTMIYSTSGSSAGVGFAIPTNTAKRVVSAIIKNGKVNRGVIDEEASLIQVNSSIAKYANIPQDTGLLVSKLANNGTAEKAGLKAGNKAVRYGSARSNIIFYIGGDVIIGLDGKNITSLALFNSLMEDKLPGDTITLTILRGKKTLDIKLTLTSKK